VFIVNCLLSLPIVLYIIEHFIFDIMFDNLTLQLKHPKTEVSTQTQTQTYSNSNLLKLKLTQTQTQTQTQ